MSISWLGIPDFAFHLITDMTMSYIYTNSYNVSNLDLMFYWICAWTSPRINKLFPSLQQGQSLNQEVNIPAAILLVSLLWQTASCESYRWSLIFLTHSSLFRFNIWLDEKKKLLHTRVQLRNWNDYGTEVSSTRYSLTYLVNICTYYSVMSNTYCHLPQGLPSTEKEGRETGHWAPVMKRGFISTNTSTKVPRQNTGAIPSEGHVLRPTLNPRL